MAKQLRAPMSGKVIKITVAVGTAVSEDDETLILEAMKMETPIYSPCDGTVTEILVKEGQAVEEDQVLMSIG